VQETRHSKFRRLLCRFPRGYLYDDQSVMSHRHFATERVAEHVSTGYVYRLENFDVP